MDKTTYALKRALNLIDYLEYEKGLYFHGDRDAIREALAEQPAQQQETKRWAVFCSQCRKEWSVSYLHPGKSICAKCDAKVGAQQQEPIAKVCHDLDGHIGWNPKLTQLPDEGTLLYTSTQLAQQKPVCSFDAAHDALEKAAGIHISQQTEQQQEPVAYIHRQGNHWEVSERFLFDDEKARGWTEEPLYTSPQSKPWVGLTDEEREQAINTNFSTGLWAMAKDIEAKLREKNV